MNKYKNIAVEIVNTIGKENIASATHCATRLRLQVDWPPESPDSWYHLS
ncbi:PTS transporter subunit EIIB [Klebsiella oxytoca]